MQTDAGPRPVDLAEWGDMAARLIEAAGDDAAAFAIRVPPAVLATLVACARALRVLVNECESDIGPTWPPSQKTVTAAQKALAAVTDTAAPGAGGSG